MYNNFFIALIIEILEIFNKNKNFFDLDSKNRMQVLEQYKIPNAIKEVLANSNYQNLLKDIESLLDLIRTKKVSTENKILNGSLTYLSDKFATTIYALPENYAYLNYDDQIKVATEAINSQSRIAKTLISILANYSSQEILNELQNLLSKTSNSPIVLIQTPLSLTSEQKIEIKQNLSEKNNANCIPVFQINKKLIGGMRLFVNGVVTDNSWLKKINLITTLKK